MLFAWRGHTKSLTTRARPSPDLAVWLDYRRPEARAEPRLVAAGAEAEPEAASAVTYLAKEWASLREEAEAELEARRLSAGEQAKASAGLYTDALGNVEVNLQTAVSTRILG